MDGRLKDVLIGVLFCASVGSFVGCFVAFCLQWHWTLAWFVTFVGGCVTACVTCDTSFVGNFLRYAWTKSPWSKDVMVKKRWCEFGWHFPRAVVAFNAFGLWLLVLVGIPLCVVDDAVLVISFLLTVGVVLFTILALGISVELFFVGNEADLKDESKRMAYCWQMFTYKLNPIILFYHWVPLGVTVLYRRVRG